MMPGTEQHTGPGARTLAGRGLTVEFPANALEEILGAALDGFLSFPFGGLEVGGVLFGVREGEVLRVMTSRPVTCEHAFGPGYTLSENDERGLGELLQAPSDPALSGLVPLGWYHSHTRGALALSAADADLHQRYFPEAWQAAMVLLPRYSKPTRVGLFLRQPDGSLPEAPDYEFESGPVAVARRPPSRDGRPAAASAPAPAFEPPVETAPAAEVAPSAPAEVLPEVPPQEIEPAREGLSADAFPADAAMLPEVPPARDGPRRRWIWAALGAILVLLSAGLFLPGVWRKLPPAHPLSLRLAEENGRLEIRWDRAAPVVREARRGVLEITDGLAEVTFPLDAKLLQAGVWSMVRQSGEVQVRLEVHRPGAEPVEESAHFVGPPPSAIAPEPPAPKVAVPADIAKLQAELESQLAESSRLERRLKELGKLPPAPPVAQPAPALPKPAAVAPQPAPATPKPAPRAGQPAPVAPKPEPAATQPAAATPKPTAVPTQPTAVVPKPPPRRTFQAPPMIARRTTPEVLGAPEIPEAQSLPGTPPVQPGRLPEAPAPPPAKPPTAARVEAATAAPVYRGPQSGRLIWTGFLAANAVLTIEKGRPSAGHITGELPGTRCRVGASPAEFSAGGLTVYSANPRFARAPVSEAPGPQNGWNRTAFRYDTRLARDLVVVEAPGPQNGWSRVVLRTGERPLAVIMLEWEVVP